MADDDVGDLEAMGSFLEKFRDKRATQRAQEDAAQKARARPSLARAPQYLDVNHPSAPLAPAAASSAPYRPTLREQRAQDAFLERNQGPEKGPMPTQEQMTGQAPRGLAMAAEGPAASSAADFSMAAHGRGGLMTSPAVVPNRATPAEMDAMSNADYLAQRGVAPPPVENPYRQGGFSRDVPPEANDYGPNPYR